MSTDSVRYSEAARSVARQIGREFVALSRARGVALGGSVARDFTDEASDIEMYVYCEPEIPPEEECHAAIVDLPAEYTRSQETHWEHECWGTHSFFEFEGWKVELGYRSLDRTHDRLDAILAVEEREPTRSVSDTPFGHYEEGLAACVDECDILYEDDDCVSELKAKVSDYPSERKQRKVHRHLHGARTLLQKKIEKAAERDDFFNFHACEARFLRSCLLVLFALNERYYPGDKWNRKYVTQFDRLPDDFLENVAELRETDLRSQSLAERVGVMRRLVDGLETCVDEEGIPHAG